ncbi:hypothetical protein NQ176_g10054 [Zarea fungicola]|uniref:Uncharacterized protein n=1 Tax=Zarea fungicola TaxID=93591 RepID=A0ACC1MI03_9HYPO|nr:hypothetical protein NQ176_g10054 [Lecanicillium fungicola]
MSGIRAEMTVSERAALYRFTFPEGSGEHPHIMLDLTDLWKSRQNASIHVDDKTGRMAGNGTFLPSFGAGSYVLHFCVDFFGADIHDTGVWVNNRAGTEPKQLYVTRGFNLFYIEAGGFVRFKTKKDRTVTVRMGISFKSNEQACQSAETEIPSPDTDFSRLVTEAKTAWQAKLSQIEVKSGGASEDLLKSFWSGAYRNMISPQNYTGENPHWDTGKPYFDSFYCMWDSFRVQHPFLTVVDPDAQAQMVQALLDIYKHDGWLPDCHMSMCSGWTQGGSNADVVIADAYHKNLSDSIDWELALQAVMTDAEDEPLEWSIHGRGGLQSWKKLDYIPYLDYDPLGFGTNSRSISRTLEYAYDDYCISTMADGMGKRDAAAKYLKRSTNWMNLWKEDQTYVPHSTAALITLLGGDEAFIKRLDYFHTIGLADISNEPVFLTVYLYHYAGRPALSASRIHTYIPKSFNSAPGGLPGNDDSGAMGSFLFFSVIGLFPVAGQNVYLISPSFFEQVSIKSPQTGKTATVRNENFDAGYKNIYIQSAKVNGKAWTKSWIGHEFFTEGWTLELVLGG